LPPDVSEGVEEAMAGLRLRSAARSDDSVHVDRAIDYDPHDTVDDGGGYHPTYPPCN